MNSFNKSVLRVNKFFKKLENINSNKIIVHTDKINALVQSNLSDKRFNKISNIDGHLFVVKPNIRVSSFPYTGGIKEFENSISLTDDPLITNIKNNGGIIVGSTNMDEAAFGGDTSSSFYGRCINPINKKLSVGGSSGGSAAAVSARLVPASTGSDTGGSIRQPAAFTGITGIKPTYGRVSRYGMVAFASSLDQAGPLTQNAYDAALLLNVMCGHDKNDQTTSNVMIPDFTKGIDEEIKGLSEEVRKVEEASEVSR